MKFTVKTWGQGRARVGRLQLPNCPTPIETPCLLLSTRKGLPHFLSPDLLSSLPFPDSCLLQVSPLHFVEGVSSTAISNIGGLDRMLGLHEYGFSAVPRDSLVCLPVANASNKFGASYETTGGRLLVKPVEYMRIISSLEPNWCASLTDEVPAWVSEKRNKTSVDRTLRWLDECLASSQSDAAVFGSIVGGCSVGERRRSASEVVKRNVSGYWIGGFGMGEKIEDRPSLLSTIMDILPEEKPRQVSGFGLPEEILQGIAEGIDLFDSTYIYHLTVGGFALTFTVDNIETSPSNHQQSNNTCDFSKINLRATVYKKDASPIFNGCCCYTCQNHSKAYINHLLNVHEMLGQILLEIHNTHQFLGFFRKIREAIKDGTFGQWKRRFLESRRVRVAAASELI